MKAITIAGRITKDAVTRNTQSADSVTNFSVAVDDRSAKEKKALFFDCSFWGKRGAAVAPYLTKGGNVTVSGELSTREYEGKTYLTVRAHDLTLQGGNSQSGQRDSGQSQQGGSGGYSAPPTGGVPDMDEEVPFAPMVL